MAGMTAKQLEAIRKRAEAAIGRPEIKAVYPDKAFRVVSEDAPALLAEVERLRNRLSEAVEYNEYYFDKCKERKREIERLKQIINSYEALAEEYDYYAILDEKSDSE